MLVSEGLFSGLVLADERTQHAHLGIHMLFEIKAELLSEPELIEVVVEALLGDADHLGGVLQTDLILVVFEGIMNIAPPLNTLNDLPNGPLLITLLPRLGGLHGARALSIGLRHGLAVLHHYRGCHKEARRDHAVFGQPHVRKGVGIVDFIRVLLFVATQTLKLLDN